MLRVVEHEKRRSAPGSTWSFARIVALLISWLVLVSAGTMALGISTDDVTVFEP
jgi:hypothetical protein